MTTIKPLTPSEQLHYDQLLSAHPGMKPGNARKDARRLAKGLPAMVDIQARDKATLRQRDKEACERAYKRGYAAGQADTGTWGAHQVPESPYTDGCDLDSKWSAGWIAGRKDRK